MSLKTIDRRLFTILLIVFVQMLGAAMILPILPLYARREFDMSAGMITLLISAFFAAQFLAGPYLGQLSDRYGRIPVLLVSQIGTVISFVMLAVAPNPAVLFAARIIDGITGGNIVVAQAYITDITPREKRTESLGYVFAVFGIGFVIGPAVGGILSATMGPRVPYLFAAGAAVIPAVLTWLALEETVTQEQQAHSRLHRRRSLAPAEIIRNSPLMLVIVVAFVGQFGMGMLQATFALYGEAVIFAGYDEDTATLGIGLLLAVVGLSQFFTQTMLLRRMVAYFGDARLVIIGNIMRTIGFALFAVALVPLIGVVASVFFALGMGLMMPPLQSLTTLTVDDESRGGVLGVFQSTISLATIFSTAIAGRIFDFNPFAPYWIGVTLSAIVLLPAFVLLRRSRTGHLQPQPAPGD